MIMAISQAMMRRIAHAMRPSMFSGSCLFMLPPCGVLPVTVHDASSQLVDVLVRPGRVRSHEIVDEGVNLLDGHVNEQLVPRCVPLHREPHEVVAPTTSTARRPDVVWVHSFGVMLLPTASAHCFLQAVRFFLRTCEPRPASRCCAISRQGQRPCLLRDWGAFPAKHSESTLHAHVACSRLLLGEVRGSDAVALVDEHAHHHMAVHTHEALNAFGDHRLVNVERYRLRRAWVNFSPENTTDYEHVNLSLSFILMKRKIATSRMHQQTTLWNQ